MKYSNIYKYIIKAIGLAVSSLAVFLCISMFFSGVVHAQPAYNNSYLIDDSVYLNANTMNPQQIQAFLSSEGSYLANYTSYSARDNANVSATEIIWEAAQDYGINPQVIMATMQKEESLITDPDPAQSQLDFAMGYGCADSSGCSQWSGLFNQVDNATWQLRFNYDKLVGSTQLGIGNQLTANEQSEKYPCGTPSTPPPYSSGNNTSNHFYYPGLVQGNNVTFYDGYGTAYTSFVLANASTASLYCYTPHAYPGSSQDYYSGSYNFVQAFDDWWGTTFAPTFQATYTGQSANPWLIQGQSAQVTISYQNTGNSPWYDDVTAPEYNTYPVHLASTHPINTPSTFAASWLAPGRPTGTFAAVYDSDDATLAPNQHIAQPGDIVKFTFNMTAPPNIPGGVYTQYVQPVLEGSDMWNMGGVAWWEVYIIPITFQATYDGQTVTPEMIRGQSSSVMIRYKNTGNSPWYDDVTAPEYDTYPVHLATSVPVNSLSPFAASWLAPGRPTGTFAAVYNPDDATLAPSQHIVQPGQIAEFDFNFTVPVGMAPGNYTQYVQPVLEGSSMWNMGGVAWWNLVVQPAYFQAGFVSQSNSPVTINPGQAASAFIRYQNTGTLPWFDSVSAPVANTVPIHLAVTNPINSSSPFNATWTASGRPTETFGSVYDSDNATLTSNQHVVLPGQIAEFDFTFTVPSNMAAGTYTQYFQPVVEGGNPWYMGGLAWLIVNVP